MDQATYIPSREDVFGTKVWFDLPMQHERFDVDFMIVHDNRKHEKISFLLDYVKGMFYEITFFNHTEQCNIHKLNGTMGPLCLAKNAVHRGTVVIGGVLLSDNYIEHRTTKNGSHIALDILFVGNVDVPIRAVRRHIDGSHSYDEYWNFIEKVHHDAFVVPQVCQSVSAKRTSEVYTPEQIRSMMPHAAYSPLYIPE